MLKVLLLFDFEVAIQLLFEFLPAKVSRHVLYYDAIVRNIQPLLPPLLDPAHFPFYPNEQDHPDDQHSQS